MRLQILSKVDDFLYFGVLLSVLLRYCTSIFPYSGYKKVPLHGDFEAQRHWMEISVNLPVREWYQNSTHNDLQYWGLDYPPLTAYHSYICGVISNFIEPTWLTLNKSRGLERPEHKIFMRNTVIVSDLLVYFPAVAYYWLSIAKPSQPRDKAVAAVMTLLYPGLILIDHGHFQYNCVSLGLCLIAISMIIQAKHISAAVFFTLALNFKQMELYHALPFFCFVFGSYLKEKSSFRAKLLKLSKPALTVLALFAICWLPFLIPPFTANHVLQRLFPVGRGIFEDKVANVWCCLSVLIKFKKLFSNQTMVIISGVTTLLSLIPSSVHLVMNPTPNNFRYALINSSLAFFLFSYQVHEKSILLVTLPVLLLLDERPLPTIWFAMIATFSMFPLLVKDGLIIPFFAVNIFYLVCAIQGYTSPWFNFFTKEKIPFWLSLLSCLLLSVGSLVLPTPKSLPHLHVLVNSCFSCAHFLGFLAYFHSVQMRSMDVTKLKTK